MDRDTFEAALTARLGREAAISAVLALDELGCAVVPLSWSDTVLDAYRRALRTFIETSKAAGGKGLVRRSRRGRLVYDVSERDKARCRYEAMVARANLAPTMSMRRRD